MQTRSGWPPKCFPWSPEVGPGWWLIPFHLVLPQPAEPAVKKKKRPPLISRKPNVQTKRPKLDLDELDELWTPMKEVSQTYSSCAESSEEEDVNAGTNRHP